MALIGLVFGFIFRKQLSSPIKLLVAYLGLALVSALASRYLGVVHNNNLILIPIYGLLEMILFSILYYRYLLKLKPLFIWILILLSSSILMADIFLAEPLNTQSFQSYGRVFEGFVLILLSLLYFVKLSKSEKLWSKSSLLFNSAILLFFIINTLWFLVVNFLVNATTSIVFGVWLINALLTLGFYLFLTLIIWQTGKNQKSWVIG